MNSELAHSKIGTERRGSANVRVFEDVIDALQPIQDVLGRKWYPPIVYHLLEAAPLGFSELKNRLSGISSKMLSESLTDLEERRFVTREIVNEQPIRVEYSLTERGRSLEPVLAEMLRWDGTTMDTEIARPATTPSGRRE